MAALRRQTRHSARSAFAEQSWLNLRTQITAFFMFCIHFHLAPLPAALDTICMYAQFLSRSFKSPQAIRNYVQGVKFLHVITGHEYQLSNHRILQLVMRGIDRGLEHMPSRAIPISPDILRSVARIIDLSSPNDVSCFCAGLFLFFLMARAGNVFYHLDHGSPRGLSRGQVSLTDYGMIVTFTRTKTISFGSRVLHIPVLAAPHSLLCPVALFRRMIFLIPAASHKPLFMVFINGRLAPFSKQSFLVHFRSLLERAGVPHPTGFSCHSFRRGGASWAFRMGIPGEVIQVYGDWASDCYKRYLDLSFDTKYRLAQLVYKSI